MTDFFSKFNQIFYIKQSLCLPFNKKTVCILQDSENLTIWCNPFPSYKHSKINPIPPIKWKFLQINIVSYKSKYIDFITLKPKYT